MKPHAFHPEAAAEYATAAQHYSEIDPALGVAFYDEVEAAIARVRRFPDAFASVSPDLRRCLLNRFPFGILYCDHPDRILILAVMHLHRQPHYWENRQ